MKLRLASRSQTRIALLKAAGLEFDLIETSCDEEAVKAGLGDLPPAVLALRLAEAKATGASAGPDLVIGSDQVLECDDGTRLGKAGSRDEAAEQLRRLSGRTHLLHSAAAALQGGETVWTGLETARMQVRRLSEAFIQSYLDREFAEVRWNVGVYRIEGEGIQLFEGIEGSHFAILGLPLLPLLAFLRSRGLAPE